MDRPIEAPVGRHGDPLGESLDDFLVLRADGPDAFLGVCHAGAVRVAFGGQLAAQALVAAGMTLADSSRPPHSLHAYFLEAASTSMPVRYEVERTRDGSSVSARRVVARQGQRVVFAMSASFAAGQSGPTHRRPMPAMVGPESCPEIPMPVTSQRADLVGKGYPPRTNIEIRIVEDADLMAHQTGNPGAFGPVDEAFWVRVSGGLPQDPLHWSAALAYLSDMRLDRTALAPLGGLEKFDEANLISLDHAMWFHGEVPTGEWLLFVHDSPSARGGRGFSRGAIYAQNGELLASTAQECLMRFPSARSDTPPVAQSP